VLTLPSFGTEVVLRFEVFVGLLDCDSVMWLIQSFGIIEKYFFHAIYWFYCHDPFFWNKRHLLHSRYNGCMPRLSLLEFDRGISSITDIMVILLWLGS
jgi:hypothetical protein